MGKSPGKWIKAKFFGKKSTNSAMTKRGEAGKEAFIVSKASSGVVTGSDPVISNPVPVVIERNGHNLASGNQTFVKPPEESSSLLSGTQDGSVKSAGVTSICNSDILKQEKAAAKVQAALRGYLARRAFWALKGIIRLQALIRGHLVRRQAVATLHCIQGIVRFQALVRGQKVRLSATGIEVKEKCNLEKLKLDAIRDLQSNRLVKLSRNDFAQKLLASSLNVMPLGIHYDSGDANSAWNWLERWSSSHFWEPIVELKRDAGSKSSRKSGGNIGVELESGKPKRSIRRNSSTHHDNSSDNGKPRGTMKKSIGQQGEATQENGQNELEKVKRNLRKISLTKTEANDKPKAVTEKPKSKASKIRETANPVVPERSLNSSVDKHKNLIDSLPNEKSTELNETNPTEKDSDTLNAITKEPETFNSPQDVAEEIVPAALDEPAAEAQGLSIQKDNTPPVDELQSKEDSNGKENQKSRRRKSISTKHEYPENDSHNTPTLPSYMQATKSAKAKLRAQGSPRLSQDSTENAVVRRHSLPSSTGGKVNTPSPRIQKLVQGSGKGGIKSDKSLSASKDYNNNNNEKVAEWRR
ncbi:unnamed protein product [Rhodiola kirilowii]